MTETIYAVATGAGRAAVAIIRISGPAVRDVATALAGRLPPAREAVLMRLRDPATDETLDRALVLAFAAPRSETGEDCLEFHLHGGPAVVAGVLAILAGLPGLRPAEPGEFARRAFANGKIDLAQVEGLADLIDAETQGQRRQAQRQLSGAMRAVVAPWRAALVEAAALVETAIDFAEDVALEASVHASVDALMAPVRDGLRCELASAPLAERMRDGLYIVIAGPPNAGKSTLLNALVRREAAIVSAVAGTTRDPVEVRLDLGGCPAMLVDTAGLRDSADEIERIGIARARTRAEEADLVLWLSDGEPAPAFGAPTWALRGKADLLRGDAADSASIEPSRPLLLAGRGRGGGRAVSAAGGAGGETPIPDPSPQGGRERVSTEGAIFDHVLSAKTGENLDRLMRRLIAFAAERAGDGGSSVVARERHRLGFVAALASLDALSADLPVEILAEHLRAARLALERLIGAVDVEDILGDVFARFCIGK